MRVKLIRQNGQAALIEYVEGGATKRGWLPATAIHRQAGKQYQANEYEAERPSLAAPYGLPWADLIRLTVTPEAIEDALHQYGIWTADDVERNHTQALAAIQSLYAPDLMNLIRSARAYQSEQASR